MIQVNIESLVIGLPSPSLVTLRPTNPGSGKFEGFTLPIRIGPIEASHIAAALEGKGPDRPMTHQLAIDMAAAAGAYVSRAVISRVEGGTFYASIHLRCENGMFTHVDARPSDAIALAIRANVPFFVEDEVFEVAACPRSFKSGQDVKIEMEEFDKFIEQVNPEDFATNGHEDEGKF